MTYFRKREFSVISGDEEQVKEEQLASPERTLTHKEQGGESWGTDYAGTMERRKTPGTNPPLVLVSDELAFWSQFRKALWIYHPRDPHERGLTWTFWGFPLSDQL